MGRLNRLELRQKLTKPNSRIFLKPLNLFLSACSQPTFTGHLDLLDDKSPVILQSFSCIRCRDKSSNSVKMSGAVRQITKFRPLFDRVLVERFAAETKTKAGIMLPEKAVGKVLDATVVAVGPGARTDNGQVLPPSVKPGDRVLLPEYGGTKVEIENKEYFLFRDSDILGAFTP